MAERVPPTQRCEGGRSTRTPSPLRLIAAFKLVKSLLIGTAGLGVLRLVHTDIADTAWAVATHLRLDPEGRLVEPLLRRLVGLDPHTLQTMSLAALVYAGLTLTEGVGLMRGKRWAEYLTVVATASLVPLEVYELGRHPSAVRVTALLVNLAIVVYLVLRLRRERRVPNA